MSDPHSSNPHPFKADLVAPGDNVWHHVTLDRSGTLYLDGVAQGPLVPSLTSQIPGPTPLDLEPRSIDRGSADFRLDPSVESRRNLPTVDLSDEEVRVDRRPILGNLNQPSFGGKPPSWLEQSARNLEAAFPGAAVDLGDLKRTPSGRVSKSEPNVQSIPKERPLSTPGANPDLGKPPTLTWAQALLQHEVNDRLSIGSPSPADIAADDLPEFLAQRTRDLILDLALIWNPSPTYGNEQFDRRLAQDADLALTEIEQALSRLLDAQGDTSTMAVYNTVQHQLADLVQGLALPIIRKEFSSHLEQALAREKRGIQEAVQFEVEKVFGPALKSRDTLTPNQAHAIAELIHDEVTRQNSDHQNDLKALVKAEVTDAIVELQEAIQAILNGPISRPPDPRPAQTPIERGNAAWAQFMQRLDIADLMTRPDLLRKAFIGYIEAIDDLDLEAQADLYHQLLQIWIKDLTYTELAQHRPDLLETLRSIWNDELTKQVALAPEPTPTSFDTFRRQTLVLLEEIQRDSRRSASALLTHLSEGLAETRNLVRDLGHNLQGADTDITRRLDEITEAIDDLGDPDPNITEPPVMVPIKEVFPDLKRVTIMYPDTSHVDIIELDSTLVSMSNEVFTITTTETNWHSDDSDLTVVDEPSTETIIHMEPRPMPPLDPALFDGDDSGKVQQDHPSSASREWTENEDSRR